MSLFSTTKLVAMFTPTGSVEAPIRIVLTG